MLHLQLTHLRYCKFYQDKVLHRASDVDETSLQQYSLLSGSVADDRREHVVDGPVHDRSNTRRYTDRAPQQVETAAAIEVAVATAAVATAAVATSSVAKTATVATAATAAGAANLSPSP